MKNILRYSILTLAFIIPFIPFFIADSLFFPFITGKGFVFRILTEIMCALWIGLAFLDPAYRPKKSLFLYAFTGLVVIAGVANIFGVNPERSMWSNYERMEGYITILHLFGYFLVMSAILETEKLWKWFWHTSIFASIIMSFYAFLQYSGYIGINQGATRVDGTFGNAIYMAVYMLFHIFITTKYLFTSSSWVRRGLYIVAIAMQLFSLFNTATRGTTLGLIAGAIVSAILIALFEKKQLVLKKVAIGILTFIVVFIGVFFLVKDTTYVRTHPVMGRFASISLNETTTRSRFIIWNMAIEGFKEKPILGWGQENFNIVFNKYYDPRMYDQEQWFDRAHNVFFDWLINAGILGLLAYLSLFATALYMLWRKNESFSFVEKSILTGLLAGYFIHNIFVFDNLISYIFFFTVIAYIYSQSVTQEEVISQKHIAPSLVMYVVLPISLIAAIYLIVGVNGQGINANRYLLKAVSIVGVQEGKPISCVKIISQAGKKVCAEAHPTLEVFKKALSYGGFGVPELREHLITNIPTIQQMEISDEEKNAYYNFAVNEMKTQTLTTPNDARYHFILGAYIANLKLYDEALASMNAAIELSPKKQPILMNKGQILLMKKDFPQAVESFKLAYELLKENAEAKKRYAYALMLAGKKDEALKVLEEGEPLDEVTLISLYYELKNYAAVERILKGMIEKDPSDLQAQVSLASVYVDMGRRAEAIKLIEQIIVKNPSFKTKGEQFIKDIKAGKNL